MKFLVTGVAGFIGYHLSSRLLADGHQVIGIDNLSDYYDVSLKKARLDNLRGYNDFLFYKMDLVDRCRIANLFYNEGFEKVIHLGAQAGVRYSLKNPFSYGDSNLIGYLNILEGCRHTQVEHLLYASSSSVYGLNCRLPFSVEDTVDHPISLYAATKKSNELMAHAYAHLYGIPTTGLRFFTVYGPWGRPDMALFKFTRAILSGECIDVYNGGNMLRAFTYIDDTIEAIVRLKDVLPTSGTHWTKETCLSEERSAPYRIYNIANSHPVKLINCIEVLETILGIQAKKNMLPIQPGDMLQTSADTKELHRLIGFQPKTPLIEGIKNFVSWYLKYYRH